ncbi:MULTISPECIES: pyrroloquinoline quinone biosynthesis protein PqqF [Pseudomonas]|uniref:Coenzyme PQQ synthesis protein F n=1 Tax=Pseudomonas monteilii TaxID=76759 RepID=A0A7W2LE94_9PSED|nr:MULTISPECIES: pyrroloquinoline quinone biosynthesis protein PqqF [Pseudomonas]MBA6139269.1 pyrroloquinoline quinone biosynthesis protein PqqF [Pseudomonas monteilii]MCA4076089.1 pyrroloquinoline quinone biosynthesis protein PqqF [Pseudomonas kurunegalensis]MDT3748068.1 pyrroloquinoline quinone biosynthesis protein PqqF [Pseudomonas kurunegalensis]MVF52402.1 pyrroloquinoline quinone biosynthesis protein PqqF [Pseudomonas monteilii]
MPDAIRHLTLANGLQLTLRHAPRLKRSAAALRVHAGSHDAPGKWPGLAHFLEHLFFLGTPRFALDDGLMRYVQTLGGQVNASTRERTTDFFFEVPPNALAGGLERLCQMLAEPDLGIERQRREREVIHAEFIAWSRNPQAQQQFTLLQSVSQGHPLGAFHAGNRYTLALQAPAFQQALTGFHQRFYQGGQIVLSLCGPQPLDELEQLGRQHATLFATGKHVPQIEPPPLSATATPLAFTHENLPAGAEQALELLIACLGDSRPGTWLGALRARGWLQRFKAETLYAFAGQLLWHLDLKLSADACADEASALLRGWFSFIRQADLELLNREFGLLQHSRERSASALELARRDSTGQPFAKLDAHGLQALQAVLQGLPCNVYGEWHMPLVDPLLMAGLPSASTKPVPAALRVSELLPGARQYAALYLRWHVPSTLRQRLQGVLEQALAPLQERCERASVQLQFTAAGEYWQLRCAGLPAAVLRAVTQALVLIVSPPARCWLPCTTPPAALIPIRALLKQLPDAVLGTPPPAVPACTLEQQQLDKLWQHTRWHGLAAGFDDSARNALGTALQHCPGHGSLPSPLRTWANRRWQHAEVPGSEHALLLFCPLPATREASGRLLAQLLQGPVYQRLRVELQLGYAVFSTFRQIEGVGGLLFGVQSPHTHQAQILDHLLTLLSKGVTLDPDTQQALASQFDEPAMANADVAEWAWQTHLATQPGRLDTLRRAILNTRQTDLDHLLGNLLDADASWLCLANAAAPTPTWK